MRRICPYPYADEGDIISLPCTPDAWTNLTYSRVFSHRVEDLLPYTTYEFYVKAFNGHDTQDTTINSTVVNTLKSSK